MSGIQTTGEFEKKPYAMYEEAVLIRLHSLIGDIPEAFLSSRMQRIRARYEAFQQVPEQVAEDFADEFRVWKEVAGEQRQSVLNDRRFDVCRRMCEAARRHGFA